MSDIAIKLENVSKYYKLYKTPKDRLKESLSPLRKQYHKEFYALRDIDLEVKKGEILGIIGKNGSGKSTLLKIISRVLTPNSGTIQVNGVISALLELGAGFNPEFSGIENVYFYGTLLGFSTEEMEQRIDGILSFADIGDFIDQPLKTYSSGMKARLGFAVATEVNPDILIVDEVLAVGDAIFQRKCYAKMEKLIKDGKTVLLVSHSRNNIASLCNRAMLLDDGREVAFGDVDTVLKEYDILCNKSFIDHHAKASEEKEIYYAQNNKLSAAKKTCKYDYSLKPESFYYRKSEAKFSDFGIYDSTGDLVNILYSGESYVVKVNIDIDEDIPNTQFAMRILNKQGLRLSWIGYPLNKGEYLDLKKGKVFQLNLKFDCNLLSETYFIDAGIQSYVGDDLYQHVGVQNIYAFRVELLNQNTFGIVYLNAKLIENS